MNKMIRSIIAYSMLPGRLRTIVNADDFGISKGVTKAIIELSKAGVVTSTSVMTNFPYYPEIKKLHQQIGVGIHLNLTIGVPVLPASEIPTLVDRNGIFLNFSALLYKTKKGLISTDEVEAEFNAQIDRLIKMDIRPDHLNSHQSLLKYPFFFPIMRKVAHNNGIPAVRTYLYRKWFSNRLLFPDKVIKTLYLAYQRVMWKKEGFKVVDRLDTLSEKGLNYDHAIIKLKNIFLKKSKGLIEIIVHPGYLDQDNTELGNYVHEREVELNVLLSNEIKKLISNPMLDMVTFKDI